MKSNFWLYKVFNSRRQKEQNGAAEGNFCGPFYFESPVNNLQVKKWIREHLGLRDTSHIEVKISLSDAKNARCLETYRKMLNRELAKENSRRAKSGARPGNLIVKWLKPEIA